MEAMEAILSRRSIRRYQPKAVPGPMIEEMLRAAMSAPSARNTQPWCFIAVDRRETLDRVPEFHPYAGMMKEAPLAILVCGDLNLESDEKYLAVNCSAAAQNLLLAAHIKGLGAVWLGVWPRPERVDGMRRLFNLPGHIIPVALIAMGFPAEQKPPEDRYKKERVYVNNWPS